MRKTKTRRKPQSSNRPKETKEQFLERVSAQEVQRELLRLEAWSHWKQKFGPFETEVQAIDAALEFWVRWHQYLTLTRKSKHRLGYRSCRIAYEWGIDPRSKFTKETHPFDLKLEPLSQDEIEPLTYNFKEFGRILRDAINCMDAGALFIFDDDD